MMRRRILSLLLVGMITSTLAADERALALSGCWSGDWLSCTSGHRGPLRATFCKINDSCYQVRFQGRFFVVLPFRYSVRLQVIGQADGQLFLAGSSYLGPIFGTFEYTAVATATEFRAEYTSRSDQGRFTLCRR